MTKTQYLTRGSPEPVSVSLWSVWALKPSTTDLYIYIKKIACLCKELLHVLSVSMYSTI